MKFKVLNKADYKTTKWSGGDTREFYIYPEYSSYQKRDFLFRISSAAVNLEKSTFTKLEGVSRKLMILAGDMELVHKDKYNKKLKPFEQDSFEGDFDTESYGKARDFNLMTRLNCSGELKHIKVLPDLEHVLELKLVKEKECIEILYVVDNLANISIEDQDLLLEKEECLIIFREKYDSDYNIKINNYTKADGNFILSTIYF